MKTNNMNTQTDKRTVLSAVLTGLLGLGLGAEAFAFTNDDDLQTPSVVIGEVCTMTTTTAAAVTQSNLESGATNDTAIFGTVTGDCNSAEGFKYQVVADGATCVFKHATLANSVTYAFNTTTPAVSSTSAPGAVVALGDGCPETGTYVSFWSVSAGSTHVSDTLALQTDITAAGVGELPDGTYSETITIRLADTAA